MSSVNDAFSVSLNPNSCVINADWDGSNPRLDNAYTDIRVYRGDVAVEFSQPTILGYSNNAVTATVTKIGNQTWRIKFATIDTSSLNGKVNLKIVVGTEFAITVSFGYTVVRETSMLDWILDWEGRAKTEIAGEHIITPKIFVGKSENGGQLTGTYIGPAFDGSDRIGVFGYSAGVEIFHLDNTGGMIGGWQITTGGITTADGNLKILSEGSIISAPGGTLAWELKKDGSAIFANGNVKFSANGNAEFAGKITSKSGTIGGWNITQNQLNSNRVIIDSKEGFIGVNASSLQVLDAITGDLVFPESPDGGVKMWYSSVNDFGFAGWSTSKLVFQLGSTNKIAGWKFDDTSLWLGVKNNTARQNTINANSITIGTSGLRGKNWYIDTDGEISFVNGLINFTANGGTICGWTLTSDHLASEKSALVSATGYVGLYLSHSTLPEAVSSYETHIRQNGGIYLTNGPAGPCLRGNTPNGKMVFQLCSNVSYIGGWNFSNSCLFTGDAPTDAGSFATQYNITLSPDGLRGYKFRLEANGSGAIAGGNISWDKAGDITFVGTKMKWAGTNTTLIDANGIFTGKISADNITAGTISTASIKCEDRWALNTDGSGYLASSKISWGSDGVLSVTNCVLKDVQIIGSLASPFKDGHFSYNPSGEIITVKTLGLQNNNCVVIPGDEVTLYTNFKIPFTKDYNGFRAIIINHDWGGVKATGPIAATAPSGMYFHEDGESMTELIINAHEAVELIGVGEGDSFKGWLVLNRRIYGHPELSIGEGFSLKAMYMGVIKYDAETKVPRLKLQRKWNKNISTSSDNRSLTISYPTSLRGNITVQIPSGVFSSPDKYEVLLTACANGVDGVNGYACICNKTANSFEIFTADDTSWNSIDVTFIIIGTWKME